MVGDGTNNDTTFYITLTIEQDDDDDDPLERIDSKIFFYFLRDVVKFEIDLIFYLTFSRKKIMFDRHVKL